MCCRPTRFDRNTDNNCMPCLMTRVDTSLQCVGCHAKAESAGPTVWHVGCCECVKSAEFR